MKKITILFVLIYGMYGFAQFPSPYCGPLTNPGGTEPITLVNFAGINNYSSNTSIVAHEDFTLITGNVLAGSTYPIKLKGNSVGPNNNNYSVYIDWNKNFVFTDAGETYNVGSLYNTTGLDAVQLTGLIAVPANALSGNTRMRVVKRYTTSLVDFPPSCLTEIGFGQTEDYSVGVTIPNCIAPANGISIVNSPTQASLSWTSSIANFEVLVQLATLPTPESTAPDGTGVNVVGNSFTANSLISNTAYSYFVRSECVIGTEFSTWTGPFNFLTKPSCVSITTVNSPTEVTSTGATLNWAIPTVVPAQYEINYGISPYSYNGIGGTTIIANTNSIRLSGLVVGATYNYFIRTKCSAIDFGLYTSSQILPLPNANGDIAIYNTIATSLDDSIEITTVADGASAQIGDAIVLSGTARLLKSINVGLLSSLGTAPYVVNMSLYTDCPSVTGAGVCGSGTGSLFPFSETVSVNVTPTVVNAIQDVVFNYNNLDLSSETDNTITVMINSSRNNVRWVIGENPIIGSMPTGQTGNGFFTRCGSLRTLNGCQRDAMVPNNFRMKIIATSANPLSNNSFSSLNFKSFPNPVRDVLNLSFDKNISNILVINLLGQEVLSSKLNTQEAKIDMSSLNVGVYLVKITADNEVKTIKIIKE